MSLPVVVMESTVEPIVTIESSQQVIIPSNRGIPGPVGPAGQAFTYVHTQATPVLEVTITHGMGKYPSVTLMNENDEPIFGFDVFYDSNDALTITFGALIAFTAYLN